MYTCDREHRIWELKYVLCYCMMFDELHVCCDYHMLIFIMNSSCKFMNDQDH